MTDWINLKELGIKKKEYDRVIKEFPVIEDLRKKLNEANDFYESEYNSYDCELEEIFKKIFNLIRKIKP